MRSFILLVSNGFEGCDEKLSLFAMQNTPCDETSTMK